jgi:peptide deformylase
MSILPIITAPDPRLKILSEPVERVNDQVRRLLDDMLATMYAAPGVGLSAIQVGVPKRVIVADVAPDGEARRPVFLINPRILSASDESAIYNEGCLSLPEHFAEIERPERVVVEHLDRDGKLQRLDADGLLARCIQHEMDHLEGVLFVDHLSAVRRNMILRKLSKARRQQASV